MAEAFDKRRVAHTEPENEAAGVRGPEHSDPPGERSGLPGPDVGYPGRYHEPARLGEGPLEQVEGMPVRVAAAHPNRAIAEALDPGGKATGILPNSSGADPDPHPSKRLPPRGRTRSRAAHRQASVSLTRCTLSIASACRRRPSLALLPEPSNR